MKGEKKMFAISYYSHVSVEYSITFTMATSEKEARANFLNAKQHMRDELECVCEVPDEGWV